MSNQGSFCRNCGLGVIRDYNILDLKLFFRNKEIIQLQHYSKHENGPYFDDEFYPHRLSLPKILPLFNPRFSDPDYVKWRKEVINKFNGFCLKCGKNGTHCHHIKNYSEYLELRFDIDNGVLFCSECHNKFHRIYGTKNNNRFQLIEFLGNKEAVIY